MALKIEWRTGRNANPMLIARGHNLMINDIYSHDKIFQTIYCKCTHVKKNEIAAGIPAGIIPCPAWLHISKWQLWKSWCFDILCVTYAFNDRYFEVWAWTLPCAITIIWSPWCTIIAWACRRFKCIYSWTLNHVRLLVRSAFRESHIHIYI